MARFGDLPAFYKPIANLSDHTDNRYNDSLADPAVKRADDGESLAFIEPKAGGHYLPTWALSKSIVDAQSVAKHTATPMLPRAAETTAASNATIRQETTASAAPFVPPVAKSSATPTVIPANPKRNRLKQTTNILVLGSDRRPTEASWRTDVIMLLALDFSTGQAGVISLPRDIYLEEIPGHRPNRINVVDYLGERNGSGSGPKLLSQVLSENLALPIHHYIRFEFESFKKVVDTLGGIQLSVDCAIYDQIEDENVFINLGPGTHTLNGELALSYVRTRRQGGDLERARRQQRFTWALRQQFLEQNLLGQLSTLYTTFADTVQSDIGPLEAIPLVQFALDIKEEDVHGMVIHPPALIKQSWKNNMFVFEADWPLIAETLPTVFERPPFMVTNTVGPRADQSICPR
ncbi:MAG: LCP family protein [Chloroflexota bacterium]